MNDLINTIENLSEILHFLVVNKELTDMDRDFFNEDNFIYFEKKK